MAALKGIGILLFILVAIFLPFAFLYWIVKSIFFGIKKKSQGLLRLIPDGVPVTGTVYNIGVDTTGRGQNYAQFEYFDESGVRYTGSSRTNSYKTGDVIELYYLKEDPAVHELAVIVDKARAKAK